MYGVTLVRDDQRKRPTSTLAAASYPLWPVEKGYIP